MSSWEFGLVIKDEGYGIVYCLGVSWVEVGEEILLSVPTLAVP